MVSIMSSLAEIEAAVGDLSDAEQQALLRFLTSQLQHPRGDANAAADGDSFAAVIGLFSGEPGPTGRHAEQILYGRDS
jgi:hypothetical protein